MTKTEQVKVIIKFKGKKLSVRNLESVQNLNATVLDIIGSINATIAIVDKKKLMIIKANPDVEYVEVDHEAHILGFQSVDIHNKGVDSLQQSTPWGISKIRATEVHDTGDKGTGIKVCVIDTGIDYNHPDLKANYKEGYNFLAGNTDPLDDNGHGTHVSGIIAAVDSDTGVVGVAPEASLYVLKVLDKNGSGSYTDIVSALQWAIDNEMEVVNMSFGGTSYSKALEDICNAANNVGILLIAAAGNSGSGSDTIIYPAKYNSVVAVAATDSNDKRASFSSMGPALEISAPGVNILSTVPQGTCKHCDPSGYKNLNGTSMACPHIVGTAALVMKTDPDLSNNEVRGRINNTSLDLSPEGRDTEYGYGRVDAKAAVDNDTPLPPPPPEEKAYKCSGTPYYICEEVPVGTPGSYPTLQECQNNCTKPEPEKRYTCTGAPFYRCVEDPNGQFASLKECQDACKKPQTETRFDVNMFGLRTKPSGIIVIKNTRGLYTAETACAFICNALKSM